MHIISKQEAAQYITLTFRKVLRAELRARIAQHMDYLEQYVALEIKYPDDVDDPEESARIMQEFDDLQHAMVRNSAAITDMLVENLHKERFDAMVATRTKLEEQRVADYEANFLQTVAIEDMHHV